MIKTLLLRLSLPFIERQLANIHAELKRTSVEIADAAAHGDLKENAEFESAKEKEHLLLTKRQRLRQFLNQPVVIDIPGSPDIVSLGTYVIIRNRITGELIHGVIAGPVEIEVGLFEKCISYNSPLGAAILGKRRGDEVNFILRGRETLLIIQQIESARFHLKVQPELVIFGNVGRDFIYYDLHEKSHHIAGSAYYAALGAATANDKVGVVTCIEAGDTELVDALRSAGVITSGIQQVADKSSPCFRVYYNSDDEVKDLGRVVKEEIGCANDTVFESIPTPFNTAEYVFIGCFEPYKQLEFILNVRSGFKSVKLIGADSVEHHLEAYLDLVQQVFAEADILFVNEREKRLTDLMTNADKYYVAKRGKKGAQLWKGFELIADISAPMVDCADATGSGDVLAGCFMAGLASGLSFQESLYAAVHTASYSVTQFGVNHILNPKRYADQHFLA